MSQYRTYHVYILTNKNRTTLYIGVTNDIRRRMLEHKSGTGSKFTYKYNLTHLDYCEEFEAITREKQLKNWHRDWKLNLIRKYNKEMKDIARDWFTKVQVEECKAVRRAEMLRGTQHEKEDEGMLKRIQHNDKEQCKAEKR